MRKVHETEFNSYDLDGCASRLIIYALDTEEEFWDLMDANPREREEIVGVQSQYGVMPGAKYARYTVEVCGDFVVVTEYMAYNV